MSIFLDNSTYNSEGFVTCFHYADFLPGVATVTNLMILILKPSFPHYPVESTSLENHRIALYVQEKSLCRTLVLLVPGFGQIAVILYKVLAFCVDCIKSVLGYSETPPSPTPSPQQQITDKKDAPNPMSEEEEAPEEPTTPIPRKTVTEQMTHHDFVPPSSENKALEEIDLLAHEKFSGAISISGTDEFLAKVKTLEPFACEVWKKQDTEHEESYCLGIQLTGRTTKRAFEYLKEFTYLIIQAKSQEEVIKLHQEIVLSTESNSEYRQRREMIEKIAKEKEFVIQNFSEMITPKKRINISRSVFNRNPTNSTKKAVNQTLTANYQNYKNERINPTNFGNPAIDEEALDDLKRLTQPSVRATYREGQREIESLKRELKLILPYDREKKQYGILIRNSLTAERIGSETTDAKESRTFATLSDSTIIDLLNKVNDAKTLVQLHENYILFIRQLNFNNAFPTAYSEIKDKWQKFIAVIIKDSTLRTKGLRQRLEYIDTCWQLFFKVDEA